MRNFIMVGLVGMLLVVGGCVMAEGYATFPMVVAQPTVVVDDGPDVVVVRYQDPVLLTYSDTWHHGYVPVYGHWNHVHGQRVWHHNPGYRPGPHHAMVREHRGDMRHRGGNVSRLPRSERRTIAPSRQRDGHSGGSREARPSRQKNSSGGRGNAQRQAERPARPRQQRERK